MQEMQEIWVWSLGWEDPLEEGTVTHSSILAWRISWTEQPDMLPSIGSQRVRHDWSNLTHTAHTCEALDLSGTHHFFPFSEPLIQAVIWINTKGLTGLPGLTSALSSSHVIRDSSYNTNPSHGETGSLFVSPDERTATTYACVKVIKTELDQASAPSCQFLGSTKGGGTHYTASWDCNQQHPDCRTLNRSKGPSSSTDKL